MRREGILDVNVWKNYEHRGKRATQFHPEGKKIEEDKLFTRRLILIVVAGPNPLDQHNVHSKPRWSKTAPARSYLAKYACGGGGGGIMQLSPDEQVYFGQLV